MFLFVAFDINMNKILSLILKQNFLRIVLKTFHTNTSENASSMAKKKCELLYAQ